MKEYLSKVKCKKCGNNDTTMFELYFVSERKDEKSPVTTTKYVSCLGCDTVFKVDDRDMTKDFLLEPAELFSGG